MDRFRLSSIASLCEQLKRGPNRLCLRQLLGIEFLLSLIEAHKQYPFEFVCNAITGFRPTHEGDGHGRLLDGELLITDLVLLAEDLSENARLPLNAWIEPVYTVADLAERFDVSTKTIFRWRRRGLAGWKLRGTDERMRLLFADRCVRRFVAQNADLVTRGSNFSQLTRPEREGIVARAAELVAGGGRTVNAVARQIAAESGRAVETIRLILKHYDEAHPNAGVFNRSPLQVEVDDQRLAVWEAYVDGETVEALARRFGKTVAWIYRTITQMRALVRYACCWIWFLPPMAVMAPFHLSGGETAVVLFGWIAVWALLSRFHPQQQFWHDALAGTRLVSSAPAVA